MNPLDWGLPTFVVRCSMPQDPPDHGRPTPGNPPRPGRRRGTRNHRDRGRPHPKRLRTPPPRTPPARRRQAKDQPPDRRLGRQRGLRLRSTRRAARRDGPLLPARSRSDRPRHAARRGPSSAGAPGRQGTAVPHGRCACHTAIRQVQARRAPHVPPTLAFATQSTTGRGSQSSTIPSARPSTPLFAGAATAMPAPCVPSPTACSRSPAPCSETRLATGLHARRRIMRPDLPPESGVTAPLQEALTNGGESPPTLARALRCGTQ